MMPSTEQQLLASARAGEDATLEALVSRHEAQVYRFAVRLCGNEEDARDVTQETLVALIKGVQEFREESELSTWLFQVARNLSAKLCRKRSGEPSALEALEESAGDVASEGPDPIDGLESRELARGVREVILTLPPTQREALVLRDLEELSADEAARITGVELSAHKSRLHRARLELQQRLAALLGRTDALPARCLELVHELLSRDEDGIDQATCIRLEQHLATCPACGPAAEQLRRAIAISRRLPGTSIPRHVQAAVRSGIRAALCPRLSHASGVSEGEEPGHRSLEG